MNKLAVTNSNYVHNQTEMSNRTINAPIGLKKHERSVFSNTGSIATSLTNLTKTKYETKDNFGVVSASNKKKIKKNLNINTHTSN